MGPTAMRFGASALQQSASRPHRPDQGMSQWAKENPGEATVAGATGLVHAMSSPGLASVATTQFQSVISPQQFGAK
jgi:hypothetical protein